MIGTRNHQFEMETMIQYFSQAKQTIKSQNKDYRRHGITLKYTVACIMVGTHYALHLTTACNCEYKD